MCTENFSQCKHKWWGCSCLTTSRRCQTECCLATVCRGLLLGFGNIQKVSWVITLLQLHAHTDISVFPLLTQREDFESHLLPSNGFGSKTCSSFPDTLIWLSWALINTCSFHTAQRNKPVKEELCSCCAFVRKAPHETQEHHVFVVKEYVK